MYEERKLGEILVDLRVLDQDDLERVLEALRRRADHPKIGQMARAMGFITEEEILAALAVQMELFPGIAHWSLKQILKSLVAATHPPT